MVRVREFRSRNAYDSWLHSNGDRIRIVDVATTKRWSGWSGFIGDTKTYTVTYEVLSTWSDQGNTISPDRAMFIAACGAALILCLVLNGWAVVFGVVGVFVVVFVVPRLKLPMLKKLLVIAAILSLVGAIQGHELIASRRQREAEARAASERTLATAEKQAAIQRAFDAMTPAEHLKQVKMLLLEGASEAAVKEADRHIDAIPEGSPEARTASNLNSRFEAGNEKRSADFEKRAARANAAATETARIAFAKSVENQMLAQGWNFDVAAMGLQHTTLRLKWTLADKVVAHQISQQTEMFESARQLGFKRMELTDGFEEAWSWKLP